MHRMASQQPIIRPRMSVGSRLRSSALGPRDVCGRDGRHWDTQAPQPSHTQVGEHRVEWRVGERQVRVALPAAMLQCEAPKPEISKVEPGLPGLCEAICIKAGG